MSAAGSSGRKRNLAKALTSAYFGVRDFIKGLPPWKDIICKYILPAIILYVLWGILWQLIKVIRRSLFPPSVSDLHKEALVAFRRHKIKLAERLFWEAVHKDSSYTPVLLSLAAFYTYSETPNCAKALKLLNSDFCQADSEFNVIRLDCKAIQAGQRVMVQTSLRQEQYLSLSSLSKIS